MIASLDNNAYDSMRFTFEFELICDIRTHSNAYVNYLSGDYIMHWIEWLEDDSAVWDIQIDTRKHFDTLSYI